MGNGSSRACVVEALEGRTFLATDPAPGFLGAYYNNTNFSGKSVWRIDKVVNFDWGTGSPDATNGADTFSVRWTGQILPQYSEKYFIDFRSDDSAKVWVDGKLLIDDWEKRSYGARLANVALHPGSTHAIRLEYFESTGNARVKLVWDAGVTNAWRGQIDSAVTASRKSDVAIVVAGIEEGEFRDRSSLDLPAHQEELIERVAALGKPTVVVLVGGSAITMPWLDRVASVVDAWYPGEVGGTAVADVLWGDENPAGRLPITFPVSEGQLPLVYNHKPTGRGDDYLDLTGQPLFPFGFGLSYTTFEYSNLAIGSPIDTNGTTTVRCTVRNTGSRSGDEVVQLYLRDVVASVARPNIQLAGFTRIHLEPGASKEVRFTIGPDQLRMLDANMKWVVEPGTFRILIGASSKDLRLRGDLVVR